MLSHKTKNLKSKKSKRLTNAKKVNKKSLKKKSCHYSSSSSSFCSSSSSSSSSCSHSCWSGCSSSSSYKSCSVSSNGCSSSSDGSCDNKKHKTLILGNKYLNIGNDALTLKFDPSRCNTLLAPTYEMGFGLSNIVNGSSTNNVLLLGLNQTTAPYVNVTPRLSGTSYIAPYVSVDFPSVNVLSTLIDDNSYSTISNKQNRFVGNDAWVTTTDTFNLTTTLTALGYHTIGKYSNLTNSIAIGPESLNLTCPVVSSTNATFDVDFRNLVVNVYRNDDITFNLTQTNVGVSMLNHGDIRYFNIINTDTSNNRTINIPTTPYTSGGITYNFSANPTATIPINANTSLQLKLTVTFINATTAYINIQQ